MILQDCQVVIDRYKSGFVPPGDFAFEDLSAIKSGEAQPYMPNGLGSTLRPDTINKGTMSSGKNKKRAGLFGLFGANKVSYNLCSNRRIRV